MKHTDAAARALRWGLRPQAPASSDTARPMESSLSLPDGSSVGVRGAEVQIRDPEGRVLVRYANGSAEIAAPSGDLTLAAPAGRIRLRSAEDIEIEAARDLEQRARRSVAVAAGEDGAPPQLRVDPEATAVTAARLSVKALDAEVAVERAKIFLG